MSKLRLVGLLSAGFCAGIGFVLACGNGASMFDAGTDAEAANGDYEPPITADRIYRVSAQETVTGPNGVRADCEAGDIVIGGGCWLWEEGSQFGGSLVAGIGYELLVNAPERYHNSAGEETLRFEAWRCVYFNRDAEFEAMVEADAVCFKPASNLTPDAGM